MNAQNKDYDPYENQALDEFEQDIEDNTDKHLELSSEEEAKHRAIIDAAALNSVTKSEHMTFRINVGLRARLKNVAKNKGLKFHTLLNSILYQYAKNHADEAYR